MAKTILASPPGKMRAVDRDEPAGGPGPRRAVLAGAVVVALLASAAPALAGDPAPAPGASPDASTPGTSAPNAASAGAPGGNASSAPASAAPSAPAPSSSAPSTPAASPSSDADKLPFSQRPIPITRRAGFTVGLQFAGAAGNVSGYPIDIDKRKPQNLTDTHGSFGGLGTVWLGGAITDWLVVGAGLTGFHLEGGSTVVDGFTIGFHTELFPLFSLGGIFRDLGVGLDTATGQVTGEMANKPSGDAGKQIAPVIDSGGAARVGASLFYDGLRLWKLSAGPYASFDYTWSPTLTQPLFVLGLRGVLYVKAPKK
jgi:hypothetical protein